MLSVSADNEDEACVADPCQIRIGFGMVHVSALATAVSPVYLAFVMWAVGVVVAHIC